MSQTMTHRERVMAAVSHRQPDRVPIDLGGTRNSTIVVEGYERLKRHFGITSATRLCDRLTTKGLVERGTSTDNRREVSVLLSRKGQQLVHAVMTERRKALRRILSRLEPEARSTLIEAFATFGEAAGELPDEAWRLGWTA